MIILGLDLTEILIFTYKNKGLNPSVPFTWSLFKDRLQILLLIVSKFKLINFYSTWDHHKTVGFRITSGGIEVN